MSKKADLLAQACIAELIESGATNYQEHHFEFTIEGEEVSHPVVVTVQFRDGLSPHQLRTQAEKALVRVEAERDNARCVVADLLLERDTAQAQLAEAVGLLRFVRNYLGEGESVALTGQLDAFLARHAQVEQQVAQGAQALDERAAFERYVANDLRSFRSSAVDLSFRRNLDGEYAEDWVQDRWEGWQARAALATQPDVRGAEHDQ